MSFPFLAGVSIAAIAASNVTGVAQTAAVYQKPPAPIEQLLEAPPTPTVRLSPDRKMMLVEQPATFPTIADVAEPRFRLAGIRFNPASNGPSVERYDVELKLQAVDVSKETTPKTIAGMPAKLKAVDAIWAPDSRHAAFVAHATAPAKGLDLWVIDAAAASAHRVGTVKVNAVLGSPCTWMPDSSALLCKTVSAARGAAPKASDVPTGPDIEESLGKVSPAPTYEDMLKTTTDENIFEYYATSELAVVSLGGAVKPLPAKGLIERATPSPDGQHALVAIVHRPFSYTFPYSRFPLTTEVVPVKGGGAAKVLSDRAAVDNLPISRDAVEAGPRDYQWRADVPATVVWVEAADGGDPSKHAAIVDKIMALSAPFAGSATAMLDLPMRLARGGGGPAGGGVRGIEWGNEHLAIVSVARNSDRKSMMIAFDPATGKTTTLYSGSSQDRYKNPGRPMTAMNATGQMLLKLTSDGQGIYFLSQGSSPKGDQPFIAVMPVGGGEEKILYRSKDPFFDEPSALLSDSAVLIRRESQTQSPNYFAASIAGGQTGAQTGSQTGGEPVQLTHFPGRYDGIKMPTRQFLKYKRADGVDLTATLWLPAGYDKSQGPLPTLMEAYPAEFKTRDTASQVSGSPNHYPVFGGGSHLYLVQAGYAILDSATIPIIGEGDKEPNDTYVEQLVDGAKAAVEKGASLGVVDPKRVAVMGHSYGAFMTANLLAHTDMFRAGIAESGAYNRSLTPFGFQNEERTYWQDPKLYTEMSPFSYADKIKTPILLIHGEADDNTGTYPIQSERFYAALKGQGATVRLVFLPLEPHAYGALETKQHVLWEINRWMETYVKPAVSPVAAAKGD